MEHLELTEVERRVRMQPTVSLSDAAQFLGMVPKSEIGYRMARRYRVRLLRLEENGIPITSEAVKPQRDEEGRWLEIANTVVSDTIRCRTDMLRWQIWSEELPEAKVQAS